MTDSANKLPTFRAFLQTRTLRGVPPAPAWVEVDFIPLRDSFGEDIIIPAFSAEEALQIVREEHPHHSLVAVELCHVN